MTMALAGTSSAMFAPGDVKPGHIIFAPASTNLRDVMNHINYAEMR